MEFVPDIPRIYTAVAEWAACMIYVLALKKRFRRAAEWPLALAFLGVFCGLQYIAGILPLYLWIPGMIAAMLAIYGCILCLCKIKPLDAVFWAARAFVLAEFAASLEWQFYFYLTEQMASPPELFFEILFLALVYGAVYIAAHFLERRYARNSRRLNLSPKDLITAASTAIMIFIISNISFISRNTPLSGSNASEIMYIRTLVDLCGVILFYAQQEQQLWMHAKLELDAMQNLFSRQYEQYVISKENIELINRKYHDLKHQIAAIRAEENPDRRNKFLEEMETGIKIYEAQNKTGNKALDTLLTGKSMLCMQNGINFTCVADGALLDFMDIMDLCSVVGNALDNAIESVMKISDPEKRLIKMAVYAKDSFVMLRFENYLEGSVDFENGLPLTTKKDKAYHGYGIKSIKAVAEKYGGSIKISTADNWFYLGMLIPMDDNGAPSP